MWLKLGQHRVAMGVLAGLSLALVVFGFQNCSDTMTPLDHSQASDVPSVPFGYKVSVDTVAHMSCTVPRKDAQSPIFTFRAGAYTVGSGVQMAPDFMLQTATWAATERLRALQQSPNNNGIYIQFSLRRLVDLAFFLDANAHIQNALGPLSDNQLSSAILSSSPQPLQSFGVYYDGLAWRPRQVAGSIFWGAEKTGEFARKEIMSHLSLVVGFTQGAMGRALVGHTASAPNRAVGKALNFLYGQGAPGEPTERVLSAVSEADLESSGSLSPSIVSWNCPANLRLRIFSRCDAGCACAEDSLAPAAQRPRLDMIRRVLPPDQWWVDTANSCVVQRASGTACYPPEDIPKVGTGTPVYPYHWVSICHR